MATKKKVKKKTSKKKITKKSNLSNKKTSKKIKAKPLPVTSSNDYREVNWTLTLVLSIFLGWLGIDRFVMGKIGTGILKLLITIITFGFLGWIWWIVDIVLIAMKYNFQGIKWVN